MKKYFGLVLTLVGALVLRLINLNQSLWLDEAITALAVKNNSFIEIITKYSPGDFHPPLYYLILKLWTNLFGYSEISLRVPSVIAGVLLVFIVYKIVKNISNEYAASLAAIFMAINPLAVYYSQEARMYMITAAAVTGAVYFFLKGNQKCFIATFLVAILCDYVPLLMIPYFLLFTQDKKKILVQLGICFLLYIPITLLLITQLQSGLNLAGVSPGWAGIVGGFAFKAMPLTFVKFLIGRISFDNKIVYGLVILPAVFIGGMSLLGTKIKSLWGWLLIPTSFGFVVSYFIPIYSYFRFIFVLPAFAALLAIGSSKNTVLYRSLILISVMSLLYFNLNSRFYREDWRTLVKYVQQNPGAVVMPNKAQSDPIMYYSNNVTVFDSNTSKLDYFIGPVYYIDYVSEIFDPRKKAEKLIIDSGRSFKKEIRFTGLVMKLYQ